MGHNNHLSSNRPYWENRDILTATSYLLISKRVSELPNWVKVRLSDINDSSALRVQISEMSKCRCLPQSLIQEGKSRCKLPASLPNITDHVLDAFKQRLVPDAGRTGPSHAVALVARCEASLRPAFRPALCLWGLNADFGLVPVCTALPG